MNVRYEPAARTEVTDSLRWYLDKAGLSIAEKFERELDSTVRLLLRFPRLGKPGPRGSRQLRLTGFPYTVHYRLDGEILRILAVAHQSRKPGYWLRHG